MSLNIDKKLYAHKDFAYTGNVLSHVLEKKDNAILMTSEQLLATCILEYCL